MGLATYKAKRDFLLTQEPAGKEKKKKQAKALEFVVQEHWASRHHFDFRLEYNGVLVSWAVPKGPPKTSREKRLAIHVEDHPFEYRKFAGQIPKGQYGAGKVEIWDSGTYTLEDGKSFRAEMEKGVLTFELFGKKLKGLYSLIKLKDKENEWLFIKKSKSASITPPEHISPMLAVLIKEPFDDKKWIFEIKWDGYRALSDIQKDHVELYSRNFKSFNHLFPEIVSELSHFEEGTVLDGEVVAVEKNGKSSFQKLQNYLNNNEETIVYYVFDILFYKGEDLREKPLIERKKILKKIFPKKLKYIKYCDHIVGQGIELFEAAKKAGLEGIIGKNSLSTYQSKRSSDWVKVKTSNRQEAIICGFTEPRGSREKFGALILGIYENKKLKYAGHVGTGFSEKMLKALYEKFEPYIQKKCPFETVPKTNMKPTWLKPKLIAEVSFSEWTSDGIMRHPVFLGLREDKKEKQIAKEVPFEEKVQLTNLDKIYFPKDGYTKGDIIDYYRNIAPFILPYLLNRPESLRRQPDGIDGESFFHKDLTFKTPDWIQTKKIKHSDKTVNYLLIQDKDSLLYAANLGCIEINPFLSTIEALDFPTYSVIDLDPEDISFDKVIETAKASKQVLDELGITAYVKTTGSRGLHICIPLNNKYSYETSQLFAKLLAQLIHKKIPAFTSLERSPSKRQKKVYLDYLQNGLGKTLACVYSVRPKEGAPVSTPLEWRELRKGLNPKKFTIKTIFSRLKKKGDLFKPILTETNDIEKCIKRIEETK